MKRYVYGLLMALLLTLYLPFAATADEMPAVSFRYDYASETIEDSDGNTYEKLDTYSYAVVADEYVGYAGDYYLYRVKNCPDRRLLVADDGYGTIHLYCDTWYREAIVQQLSDFIPGNSYGVVDTSQSYGEWCKNIYAAPVDGTLIESLYRSEQTVSLTYGDAVDNARYFEVCIFSADGVFYTPVGLLTEWDGELYYADLRLLEGAEFRYNGQPAVAFNSTVQAVKLTLEQEKIFSACQKDSNQWYEDHSDFQLNSDIGVEEIFPFTDAVLIVLCALFLVLAPLAGMIVGVIVSVKSPNYRAFGVGLFILCTLVLAAFCMLLAVFL